MRTLAIAIVSMAALAASAGLQPAPAQPAPTTYQAAFDQARLQFRERHYAQAVAAWRTASELAENAPGDPVLARANALIGESVSIFYHITSGRSDPDAIEAEEQRADDALEEAMVILGPMRNDRVFRENLNSASVAYATALAWRAMHDTRRRMLERPRTRSSMFDACATEVIADPRPRFRPRSVQPFGSVVVRFHIDAAGQIVEREIVTAAPPNRDLTNLVEPVMRRWTIRRDHECADPYAALAVVRFEVP